MTASNPTPSKIIPNTFQTPNILTDDGLLALLTGQETKCYIAVIRKTFGWRKDRDRIAKSQLMAVTGLGQDGVDEAMRGLLKFGLIIKTAANNHANEGNEWAPQMDDSLIDFRGLRDRQSKTKDANIRRTEKARRAKRGGRVPQSHPVPQPGGGVVPQPPQQPITANNLMVINVDIAKKYEQEFGILTPMIAKVIQNDCDIYPVEWIVEAMEIAVTRNKRNWKYVQGILKNCKSKNIRPSLNRMERQNAKKHNAGNSAYTKQSQPKNKGTLAEYSQADLDAAEIIAAMS